MAKERAAKPAAKEPKPTPPPPPKAEEPKSAPAPAEGGAATATVEGEAPKKKKRPGVPPRRGKKLRNHLKNQQQKLAKEGAMPLRKALQTLKSMKRAKFDETVEIHMKLGIDTKQADQAVRGSVPLPHGIGKAVRIVVFTQGDDVAKAKAAGADFAGGADLIQKIQQENWLEFDVALASQALMGQVSRLGKVLGPRGLMPTPKAGTVIPANGDVAAAVREFKAGKVEYRADAGGNVHAGVGKLSFDEDKLNDNITAFVEQVRHSKPAGVRGNYVESVTVSATMSPGIRVAV
ncbi:MAG TPA: 50S ribosomal protein L1 [Gemmataceae bacterium]|nr:50S ribosomal protein L1 [Gemmataceae bacterium]